MNRTVLLLPTLACAIGCDPISHTHIIVRPESTASSQQSNFDEAVHVAEKAAAQFELREVERAEHDIPFTDAVAGQNPDLWLTLKQDTSAANVEIAEMYISQLTDKHKQLAATLIQKFGENGKDAELVYQTDDGDGWIWLAFTAIIAAALACWRFASRRRTVAKEQSAGRGATDNAIPNG